MNQIFMIIVVSVVVEKKINIFQLRNIDYSILRIFKDEYDEEKHPTTLNYSFFFLYANLSIYYIIYLYMINKFKKFKHF